MDIETTNKRLCNYCNANLIYYTDMKNYFLKQIDSKNQIIINIKYINLVNEFLIKRGF